MNFGCHFECLTIINYKHILILGILKVFLQSNKFGIRENIIFEKCVEWSKYQAKEKSKQNKRNNDKTTTATTKTIAVYENDANDIIDEKNIEQDRKESIQDELYCKSEHDYFNLIKYFIRFPIMNGKYFNSKVIDSTMLNKSECLDIIRYIDCSPDLDQIQQKVEKIWNCNPRHWAPIFKQLGTSELDLTSKEILKLNEFMDDKYDKYKWKLLFRASEHNFRSSKFHEYCDNKGPTVTIVKSKEYENIFGAFTQQKWHSNNKFSEDANAFVFLLRRVANAPNPSNNDNQNIAIPVKWMIKHDRKQYAICGSRGYGPVFGAGHDFHLYNNGHQITSSCSNLGDSYDVPNDTTLLAGVYRFTVKEYEVWLLQQQ